MLKRMVTTTFGSIAVLGVAILMVANSAFAEPAGSPPFALGPTGSNGYAGILLGPSFVNDNIGTNFAIGGHIGGKISSAFSLGFYGTYQSLGSGSVSSSDGSLSASGSVSEVILAAEPNFWLMGDNGLYIGAKVGIGITSAQLNVSTSNGSASGSGSETNFAGGPAIGYNFMVNPNFGIGGEFNAIFVTTSGSTLDLINVLFSASYWF